MPVKNRKKCFLRFLQGGMCFLALFYFFKPPLYFFLDDFWEDVILWYVLFSKFVFCSIREMNIMDYRTLSFRATEEQAQKFRSALESTTAARHGEPIVSFESEKDEDGYSFKVIVKMGVGQYAKPYSAISILKHGEELLSERIPLQLSNSLWFFSETDGIFNLKTVIATKADVARVVKGILDTEGIALWSDLGIAGGSHEAVARRLEDFYEHPQDVQSVSARDLLHSSYLEQNSIPQHRRQVLA